MNGYLVKYPDDARRRKFDTLLVWALDRLSREGPLAILTLVNRLKICGVKVHILSGELDRGSW